MSSLHKTELEVKLNGLQELMDLKKTIYKQVKNAIRRVALAHMQATMQKNSIFVDSPTTGRTLFQIYTKIRACPGELHDVADNSSMA